MKRASLLSLVLVSIFAIAVSFLSGCGYTTRSMVNDKFKTIYVTPFINKVDITNEGDSFNKYKIYRPMIESNVTNAVINRFAFDGNLRPGKDGLTDLILKGELIEFREDALRYTENDAVAEYRINLVVNISLWDRQENKMIWEENSFTGDTTFFTSGPQSKSESAAVADALNDLARRIVERTVEQW